MSLETLIERPSYGWFASLSRKAATFTLALSLTCGYATKGDTQVVIRAPTTLYDINNPDYSTDPNNSSAIEENYDPPQPPSEDKIYIPSSSSNPKPDINYEELLKRINQDQELQKQLERYNNNRDEERRVPPTPPPEYETKQPNDQTQTITVSGSETIEQYYDLLINKMNSSLQTTDPVGLILKLKILIDLVRLDALSVNLDLARIIFYENIFHNEQK
jgi:hypothetical protein